VAAALAGAVRDPRRVVRAARIAGSLAGDLTNRSQSPLRSFGRARRLAGIEIAFEPLREAKRLLGGRMIDVLLTGVAGAAAEWHRTHGLGRVGELLTLVPINLRPADERGLGAGVGNRATGIMVKLPLRHRSPLRRFEEIRSRVEERKSHPAAEFYPMVAEWLAAIPRPIYRRVAFVASQQVDLIVTNVPGVPVARYVAGAEITGAYPFAPVAPHCPVSVALYGYRGRLFVGLDADATSMPDVDAFREMLARAFAELVDAARKRAAGGARRG
jgi:hypothetical protein